jgi:starvation-inducible DNA-binding protein
MTEEISMSDLGNAMKVVLADTFTMYMIAHKYHFNVEGRDFYEYHNLFQKIYEELWASVDDIAEKIRALDEYVPFNFGRLSELATVDDDSKIPTSSAMISKLLETNDQVISSLKKAVEQAKIANDEGVINFLGGRLESHAKHGWFLRASTKQNRE